MSNLRFKRSSALSVAMLVLLALVVPLVGVATANHPSNSCLDVEPESETNPVGSNHTLTATLRSTTTSTTTGPVVSCEGTGEGRPSGPAINSGASGVNIDFEVTGTNDPEEPNADSPATPDLTCTILPGNSSCTVEYQGLLTGDDVIRGWIDHDGRDGSQGGQTEADMAEGPNSATAPGTGCPGLGTGGQTTAPEPDCTDVVTKEWVAGPPATLDCDDENGPDTERETNPSQAGGNSNETYTCTVRDANGNPTDNRDVSVFGEVENSVNDPDAQDGASYESPDYRCQTNNDTSSTSDDDGICTITVGQVEGEVGTAEICFWVEENEGASTAEEESFDFPGTFTAAETPNEGGDAQHCGGESTGEAQLANGSDTGNDLADQVEKTWEPRRASSVDAEPETDTNQPGENHTITAFVYDQFGGQFSGSNTVHFEFFQGSPSDGDGNTPTSPDKSCTTQGSNQCSITYTSTKAGVDLVCAFVGTAPAMSGDSTNGTCDGESLNDADDDPGVADSPEGNDDQDVVQKRWGAAGTAGTATRLDCEPETDSNPTGTAHTITCTARDNQNNVVTGENIDAEATGANDPDNGDSPTTPDFTCTTNASGQCTFTHGPGGTGTTTSTGETQYRAWIDSDNSNLTTESDRTEGQAETTQAGGTAEPDNTDVVTKTWTGNGRRIDCEPETATNQTGTNHTVTCTVTDATGKPVQGESVTFTESGPGQISPSTATTDANGRATTTATSSEAGEQTITGTITNDTTGNEPSEVDECDKAANDPSGAPAGECSDSVTKTWTAPPSPQCSDGVDNDGDGKIDHPADPGCSSPSDNDETDAAPQCSDSIDNDGDGKTDHPSDPGCDSPQDNDETDPQPVVESGPCAGYQHNSSQPRPGGNGLVVVGSPGPDNLVGSEGDDLLCALGGRDSLRGLGGDDDLYGGGGHDNIRGTAGDDSMYGGRGLDVMRGGSGNDLAKGQGQDDAIRGFTGRDRLIGGSGNDTIRAGDGRDNLVGNAGDDILDGGGGRDRCRGGRGKDILSSC